MREKILRILQKNSRLSNADIAAMTGSSEQEVADILQNIVFRGEFTDEFEGHPVRAHHDIEDRRDRCDDEHQAGADACQRYQPQQRYLRVFHIIGNVQVQFVGTDPERHQRREDHHEHRKAPRHQLRIVTHEDLRVFLRQDRGTETEDGLKEDVDDQGDAERIDLLFCPAL